MSLSQSFYHGCPLLAPIGRVTAVAKAQRKARCQLCTAGVVTARLARPQGKGGVIGRFASEMLASAGWRP